MYAFSNALALASPSSFLFTDFSDDTALSNPSSHGIGVLRVGLIEIGLNCRPVSVQAAKLPLLRELLDARTVRTRLCPQLGHSFATDGEGQKLHHISRPRRTLPSEGRRMRRTIRLFLGLLVLESWRPQACPRSVGCALRCSMPGFVFGSGHQCACSIVAFRQERHGHVPARLRRPGEEVLAPSTRRIEQRDSHGRGGRPNYHLRSANKFQD